jgi:hypothetical protein
MTFEAVNEIKLCVLTHDADGSADGERPMQTKHATMYPHGITKGRSCLTPLCGTVLPEKYEKHDEPNGLQPASLAENYRRPDAWLES